MFFGLFSKKVLSYDDFATEVVNEFLDELANDRDWIFDLASPADEQGESAVLREWFCFRTWCFRQAAFAAFKEKRVSDFTRFMEAIFHIAGQRFTQLGTFECPESFQRMLLDRFDLFSKCLDSQSSSESMRCVGRTFCRLCGNDDPADVLATSMRFTYLAIADKEFVSNVISGCRLIEQYSL